MLIINPSTLDQWRPRREAFEFILIKKLNEIIQSQERNVIICVVVIL